MLKNASIFEHNFVSPPPVPPRVLERLGLCHQVRFTRWFRSRFLNRVNPAPPGLRVLDRVFSGVPVRIYEPTTTSTSSTSRTSTSSTAAASLLTGLRRGLVYFHGGGWVMGSIGTLCGGGTHIQYVWISGDAKGSATPWTHCSHRVCVSGSGGIFRIDAYRSVCGRGESNAVPLVRQTSWL